MNVHNYIKRLLPPDLQSVIHDVEGMESTSALNINLLRILGISIHKYLNCGLQRTILVSERLALLMS